MGIFTNKVKSTLENYNYSKSLSSQIIMPTEKSKIIELNMNKKQGSSDEREEGEIIDEFEDIISSDEEFSMRKRIEELEAKNAELEKIANISVSAVYASGGYNDFPKKDSHHLDRYPLVSINISDEEDYPPAPKMPRITKRRKSMQQSSSRHKLLHTSSSSHRRRKRSSSPPPAPQYRQSDKLLLSLFHERVAAHNSHASKRKRKTKKTHSSNKSSRRKSREYYVSDTEDDYNNVDSCNVDDNHEHFNRSDCDKSYSLNRDELRVALVRNTHRIEQHASLKDRLTRKKENTDMFNFVPAVDDSPPPQEVIVVEEVEPSEKPSSLAEEKAESDDNMEEQELRILALKSAVLKKHMVRKKRNENIAYSPSDFDEIYKCINESPSLNNIDEQEACNSMEISPVPSPKMILSDDGGIDTKPVDMDIVNSDSECDLPSYDKWIPIEQIPLPSTIGSNEEIYNPTPMRYNSQERLVILPDVRYKSASISPKNFDSEVDEEELALRALLLSKMNSPKVNKIVKEEPRKVVQAVQSPDADVSMEAEALRNFLISNMKKKAKPKNTSASVLKEAVRRLTGKNTSPSPTQVSIQSNNHPVKTADETEKDLSQAITDMANVNIGVELEPSPEISKDLSSSCGIRVRNIDTLRAPQKSEVNLDVMERNQEKENSKETPVVQNHQKNSIKKDIKTEKTQPINLDAKKIVKNNQTLPVIQTTSNNILKSVSSQKNKTTKVFKPLGRNLTVKIEKMILPNTLLTKNVSLKAKKQEIEKKLSKEVNCIDSVKIKTETISGNSPSSITDVIKTNKEEMIFVDVDPTIIVKIERVTDQSQKEKEEAVNEGCAEPTGVVDISSINQDSEGILLDQGSIPLTLDDVDPKQVVENLQVNIPKVSIAQNENQETPSAADDITNDVVENMDSKPIKVTEIRQDQIEQKTTDIKPDVCGNVSTNQKEVFEKTSDTISPDASTESENSLTNQKSALGSTSAEIASTKNILNIVDSKDMEKDMLKKSSNESLGEEVVLELVPEAMVSPEKVSKASPTKLLSDVDSIETKEAIVVQGLISQEVIDQKNTESDNNTSLELISKNDILPETKFEVSAINDETIFNKSIVEDNVPVLAKQEDMINLNSNTTSKSEILAVENPKGPLAGRPVEKSISKSICSSKSILSSKTRQVTLGTKSIAIKSQQNEPVDLGNRFPLVSQNMCKVQNTSKLTEKPVVTVEKPDKSVINTTLPDQKKILAPTSNTVTQKPKAKLQLPNQQPITTRTKIVKPNKVINQQTVDLKRKTNDNLPQLPVPTKKPKIEETNRLITTAEIPKVPELVIRLRVSESESEYSELSAHDMEEDEDSRVRNFFNRSIIIGNEYYDIASPISLPMESPCDTPTRSGSPTSSRTQTPQPSVEKSIVNDYFEAKLEQFLKNVRSKVSVDSTVKTIHFEGQEIPATVNSTPVAVRHLPEASQQEYRRLINRMKMLERQKQAKNMQVHVKTDSGASDLRTPITDSDTKFLVRKVLVKNTTTKPSSSVIPKPKSSEKTEKITEKPCTPQKSVNIPQKITSTASQDGNATKSSKENLLVLYENSYRKTGTSIICNLDKSIEMVMVAKKAKMAKLKYEQRLRELRKQMEDVQKNLKEQQEKISKVYPEICNSHRAIESLKTRRMKINKAVTALGKSVIGPNYSMQNDQKSIISEKSKMLAAEIKVVNTMKLIDVEILEDQNSLNLPENAKQIIAPVQNLKSSKDEKLPTKTISVVPLENLKTSIEIQTSANSLLEEQLPAHKNDMPPMPPSSASPSPSPSPLSSTATIKNEVPTCDDSQSPEILNKSVPEDDGVENHVNDINVPAIFSNIDDDEKACFTANGHEEALELKQPVAVGDNNNTNEQAPEQSNMDENDDETEENGGEQVGSAKLQDYVSPLSHLRDERHINPNGVVCPYQLMGQCDDKDCKYMHLEY